MPPGTVVNATGGVGGEDRAALAGRKPQPDAAHEAGGPAADHDDLSATGVQEGARAEASATTLRKPSISLQVAGYRRGRGLPPSASPSVCARAKAALIPRASS